MKPLDRLVIHKNISYFPLSNKKFFLLSQDFKNES